MSPVGRPRVFQPVRVGLWLPALACARDWRATAEIDLPRRAGSPGGRARLELSTDLGLEGDSAFLGYVPEELADLQRSLADKFPTWTWQDAQLLPMHFLNSMNSLLPLCLHLRKLLQLQLKFPNIAHLLSKKCL